MMAESATTTLQRNGREHVKENFLMTTNVQRWLLLLQILLRGGKA
jgi:hypothetical protein